MRRLIRYLKAWSILNIDTVKSRPSAILLTVLVSECYHNLNKNDIYNEDEALTAILHLILARLRKSRKVYNPVNTKEVLSNRLDKKDFDSFIAYLEQFYNLAKKAISAETEIKAADMWSKIFKHFFPLPEPNTVVEFSEGKINLQLVSRFDPHIYIEANRKKAIYQKPNQWHSYNQIGKIPKNCTITFKLMNVEKLPYGATVEWIVRNEGDEAERVNDLGHLAGTGYIATENSLYKGCHYMDCIIRQYGQVISMRRVPVNVE